MSWTNELYQVYEKNCGRTDCNPPLLPLSHSTANAQIEVVVDENGDFISASKVEKADAVTVIPVTNDSAARSSGISPHPFADKLIYIAGDYPVYCIGKNSNNTEYFKAYMDQLQDWMKSGFGHKALNTIHCYLMKKCLMKDLISCNILVADEESEKLKSNIKIAGILQEDSFVRFRVQYLDATKDTRTWADESLQNQFIAYISKAMQGIQLCYATGKFLPVTYKHPSKIRNPGDKAKLISANDESGFSYRGRFENKEQAISVSYDFSQRLHAGLKWLIEKQGVNIENSLMLVVWESALRELPSVVDAIDEFTFDDEEQYADTFPAYKDLLKKSIFGYKSRLDKASKAMVLGLDSATTGRLSIVIYSELSSSDLLENIQKWHEETAWVRYNWKLKQNIVSSFALKEIIECAYGVEQEAGIKCKSEIITDYICRLLPCVIDRRKVPGDILRALVGRASNPLKYSKKYNWQRVLETTCAMLRKQKIESKEECEMALDEKCRHRSYLYGRLLAVADLAESRTYEKGEDRITNAMRYFEAFSNRPYTTWDIIRKRLEPYLEKMPKESRAFYKKLIDEITDLFELNDFLDNSKLEPEYLHAYSSQTRRLYEKNQKENKEE